MRNRDLKWTDFPFSQGELEQAARAAGQAITDALPEPEDCTYGFSQDFQRKMDGLTQKTDRSGWGANLRRAACFLLVFLVGGVAWCSVDAQAREAVFALVSIREDRPPEELYGEYQVILAEINEAYDCEIRLAPLEEMDQDNMRTKQGFRADAVTLAKAAQYIESHQGGTVMERGPVQEFFRSLFGLDKRLWGIGTREVTIPTESYTEALGLTWILSADMVVSTPTGPVSYYFQDVLGGELTPAEVPEGYQVEAVGPIWYGRTPDLKTCAFGQIFTLTKNEVSVSVEPWVVIQVNRETGEVTVGEESVGADLRPRNPLGPIPEEAVGEDTRADMLYVMRYYLPGDSSEYRYVSHEELWSAQGKMLTWELKALRELSMDLFVQTGEKGPVPSGYLYQGDTAYTLVAWADEQLALTEYTLLSESDGSLYRTGPVLVVQGMQEWEREMLGYYE